MTVHECAILSTRGFEHEYGVWSVGCGLWGMKWTGRPNFETMRLMGMIITRKPLPQLILE